MGCTVATWPTRGFETLGSAIPTWVFYRARVGAGRVSGSGFTSLLTSVRFDDDFTATIVNSYSSDMIFFKKNEELKMVANHCSDDLKMS